MQSPQGQTERAQARLLARQLNIGEEAARARIRRARIMGVSYPELKWRTETQGCDICGRKKKVVRDHNHKTGVYRGWLCSGCNTGLGLFHDSVERLKRAAEYLEWRDAGEGIPVAREIDRRKVV